ncbi:MAG: DMT family transporter [Aigarchaeota archaeon]|nr:DMT family transporter [Candidatus Pelearchaeum maunauluense]
MVSGAGDDGEHGLSGVKLAILAGLGFGGFYVFMDRAGADALWPSVVAKLATLLLIMIVISVVKIRWWPKNIGLAILVGIGVLDLGGNAFFVLAAQLGRLDVASVLSSPYPANTVLLARVMLKERLNENQKTGITLALISIPP